MSRAVDCRATRVGFTTGWKSTWYAENDNYADNLIEDYKIRELLNKRLRSAGVDSIAIERSMKSVKLILKVAKPGIVIGRKGADLSNTRKELKKITSSDIEILVEEVKQPELSAGVVANNVAMQLERRMSPKRVISMAADKAFESGAKGIRVQVAGTLFGPSSMCAVLKATRGAVSTQTIRVNIDYSKATARTIGGAIGVKVWINKGEYI